MSSTVEPGQTWELNEARMNNPPAEPHTDAMCDDQPTTDPQQ